MPGFFSNNYTVFTNQADRPSGVINETTQFTLTGAQGHHLIDNVSADNSILLQRLQVNGLYDHVGDGNKMWLPTSGNDAAVLGMAAHSGRHVDEYKLLVSSALSDISVIRDSKYTDLVRDGMTVAVAEQQADLEAAARIKGFQNFLRASLTATMDDPGKYTQPNIMLALNKADDKNLMIAGMNNASEKYVGLYDPDTFSIAQIEDNQWYRLGFEQGLLPKFLSPRNTGGAGHHIPVSSSRRVHVPVSGRRVRSVSKLRLLTECTRVSQKATLRGIDAQ